MVSFGYKLSCGYEKFLAFQRPHGESFFAHFSVSFDYINGYAKLGESFFAYFLFQRK